MTKTITSTGQADGTRNPLVGILRTYTNPYVGYYTLGLITLLLGRIPQRLPELIIGIAFDALLLSDAAYTIPLVPQSWIPDGRMAQFWLTIGILAGSVLLASTLDWVSAWFRNQADLAVTHDLRTDTYDAAMSLEMSYFDNEQTGEVMSRVHNDTQNLVGAVGAFYSAVTLIGQVIVAFVFMALLNWQLALALVVFPIFVLSVSRFYARALEPRHEAVRESVGDLNARLENTLDGIRTVKMFTREPYERERVAEESATYRKTNWQTIRLQLKFDAVTWMANNALGKVIFIVGGYWVLMGPPAFFGGSFTAGSLLTFMLYSRGFLEPVKNFAVHVIDSYENALASSKRVDALLSHEKRQDESRNDVALDATDGRVAYESVSFSYEDTDDVVLENIDFTAHSGELVGIVGSTGAGKSTLIKLLFRFYEPDSGVIRIDGQDIQSVRLRSLRRHLGYVSQDPFLFDGTVRENIAYAQPNCGRETIVEAAKAAGAHEFITDLADGYDAQVGERGVKLSGGQRQRIAIARSLLRDPTILVLDEATSHVDNETELHIQQSLEELAGDRTTFAIAHRLSTVRNADRILVLDDGEIVEEGTHENLLAADGVYADLWRIQVGDLDKVSDAFLESHVQEAVE